MTALATQVSNQLPNKRKLLAFTQQQRYKQERSWVKRQRQMKKKKLLFGFYSLWKINYHATVSRKGGTKQRTVA